MLSYYAGWNYILELYFWIIIAALLIISVTIFFVVTRGGLEHYDSKLIYSGDGDNEQCNFGNFDFKLACQHRAFYYAVDLDYTDEIPKPTSTN